jgi:serine phosphatase RsbU (regulator of sigma subunit)
MLDGTYKKLLNAMPEGVFVFDDKLRVSFTNVAFRRSFAGVLKGKTTLAGALGCKETGKCGENAACAYCTFYKVMRAAVAQNAEKTETMQTTVQKNGRLDRLSIRIRILPADKKGKLFLGVTDIRYETEMERDILSAQQMQRRLLPAGKSIGGVPYAYLYIPCSGIGGDLPDVYELDGQVYGILSDVSGHGVSASMLAAFLKAGLDKKQPDLGLALRQVNEKFSDLNLDERSYITAAAVRVDKRVGTLRYVIAGHNAPILLKTEEGVHEIESPAPPISTWMSDYEYCEKEMSFQAGDILAMITDGVTECVNSAGEQFGIERTESVLLQSHSAEDFITKLKAALHVFCGGKFSDDVTAVAFDL